jgi:hypothetical protein
MRGFGLAVLIIGAILLSVTFKSWQCAEMFPDANRLACIFWK